MTHYALHYGRKALKDQDEHQSIRVRAKLTDLNNTARSKFIPCFEYSIDHSGFDSRGCTHQFPELTDKEQEFSENLENAFKKSWYDLFCMTMPMI